MTSGGSGRTAIIDRLAYEIAEMAAHIDAATHRLLSRIREFDEELGWAAYGARSCARWLSWRVGLDLTTAREKVRVARALGRLSKIDDALREGRVSYAKVRAMTRIATPDIEEQLLDMALQSTGAQLEKMCKEYRRVRDNREVKGVRDASPTALRYVRKEEARDGMVRIEAVLHPDEVSLVLRALEAPSSQLWRGYTGNISVAVGEC